MSSPTTYNDSLKPGIFTSTGEYSPIAFVFGYENTSASSELRCSIPGVPEGLNRHVIIMGIGMFAHFIGYMSLIKFSVIFNFVGTIFIMLQSTTALVTSLLL